MYYHGMRISNKLSNQLSLAADNVWSNFNYVVRGVRYAVEGYVLVQTSMPMPSNVNVCKVTEPEDETTRNACKKTITHRE